MELRGKKGQLSFYSGGYKDRKFIINLKTQRQIIFDLPFLIALGKGIKQKKHVKTREVIKSALNML